MRIPDGLGETIERVFGSRGGTWLVGLDGTIEACIHKWALSDCAHLSGASVSLVCHAVSPVFGQVVLKIGVPHPELFTEMETLSIFQGRAICRCYDADASLGALLLERIMPGRDLTTWTSPIGPA